MERAFLLPVDISPCPLLPAIVSQMFPARDQLYICGRQDFVSALEAVDNLSATNSPAISTIIIGKCKAIPLQALAGP
jgi:hypothetical protein